MEFRLTEEQEKIRRNVRDICGQYPDGSGGLCHHPEDGKQAYGDGHGGDRST
jgi:hypothetical protein